MIVTSDSMKKYFDYLTKNLDKAYKVAIEARKKGYDPEDTVNIPIAKNMAQRVEGLISAVAPQLVGSGVTDRIVELEKQYEPLDWRVALVIAKEVAHEKFCKFSSQKEAMEVGIRTGFAYHTVGVVAAPLEGFVGIKIKKRRDGKEYISMNYAGPIRGAGGTASAFSVMLADYVAKSFGYSPYDPTDEEAKRYVVELTDYDERVTNLQYRPSDEEIFFLAKHLPVEIGGDPTESIDVSNYKNLPRVETNRIRGGVALVMSMVALKAPKLLKQIKKWGHDFGLVGWDFLYEFVDLQKRKKAEGGSSSKKSDSGSHSKLTPDYTFIADLVAGRPVFSYPLRSGGFRLRYGHARTSAFSAAAIHPSTMIVLDDFIAIGTQLKLERPGKAASMSACDTAEPPIVLLNNGSVLKLKSTLEAKKVKDQIKEILYLGDIILSYGDFLDRGHKLVPVGYCPEWYVLELKKALSNNNVNPNSEESLKNFCDSNNIDFDSLYNFLKKPLYNFISFTDSLKLSLLLDIPIEPEFTFYYSQIDSNLSKALASAFVDAVVEFSDKKFEVNNLTLYPVKKILFKNSPNVKRALELIGIPHSLVNKETIFVASENASALFYSFGFSKESFTDLNLRKQHVDKILSELESKDLLGVLNGLFVKIRDKAGTFIGARMGRPEKAKMRKLTGSPHILFPVGDSGGRMRSFQSALEKGFIIADLPMYYCPKCKKDTIYPVCEDCGSKTIRKYLCDGKETFDKKCEGNLRTHKVQKIDIRHYFEKALEKIGDKVYPDLIKGVRGTSNKDHTPENLVKGILRAKYDIYVNKDGTTRFDMTELPITHFKPKEISVPIERLRELGYETDIYGNPLVSDDQILELKPQDVILPGKTIVEESADAVLFRVSKFVDEELEKLYGLKPFYNLKSPLDLVGHLVIGLAPHTSAGILGRIIGFSSIQALLAHPLFHAAMRRDCDGDEACVILLEDALLNFSRTYLPDKRGARTMDAPLVLTSLLNPGEVDDMVHKMEAVYEYPLELYEAALEYKQPWEVKIDKIADRLNTPLQYEHIGFTHDTQDINNGTLCSAYKTLPTMKDKIRGQMHVAEIVRAVNSADVASLVINKHLLKDIRGNLRKFSKQGFRCVNCNKKFRRFPLNGKCDACGGKIIFTISEGSVMKYLEPSLELVKNYNLDDYTRESLEVTKFMIESVFGKNENKQESLKKWFG